MCGSQNTRLEIRHLCYLLCQIKKRISIASSSIPDKYRERYKKYLSRFSAISVREQKGIDIIEKELLINCNSKIVLASPSYN